MKDKVLNILLFICGLSFWWQARLIVSEILIGSTPFELGRVSVYGWQLLLFITTVGLLVNWILTGRQLKSDFKWYLFFSLFIVYLVGRTIFSQTTVLDFSILYQWLLLLVFVFALRHYTYKTFLIYGVLVSGLTLALWAWCQWLVQGQSASTWLGIANHYPITAGTAVVMENGFRLLRVYAGLPHPNILGGYLVIIILVAVNYFKTDQFIKHRHLSYAYLLFLISALMLTFSRSALMALVVGLGIWFFENRRQKYSWHSLTVILVGLSLLLISLWPAYFTRFNGNNYLESKSVSERIDSQNDYWSIIKNQWFFGLGFSGYQSELIKTNPSLSGFEIQPVHNAGLFLLAQVGLVGLLIFIFFIIVSANRFYLLAPILVISFFDHYLVSFFCGLVLLFFVLNLSDEK